MSDLFHPDRLQRLAELREQGVDPYPPRTPAGREFAAPLVAAADQRQGEQVRVAGRMLGRRGYGKLAFLDVHDQSGKIQVCVQKDKVAPEEFALLKALNLGDFITVAGEMGRTKLGEPTIFATTLGILSKGLLTPPEKWHGLADSELRARLRYVDLFSNPEVRDRYLRRTQIIEAMRKVFLRRHYAEVETPVLHPIYGGATARPFSTHHNALHMDLFLRIAPELYLKRLLVGGIERVFEFARVFRNEGVSNRHNPEFTMLEFYEAYTDYNGMARLTQALVKAAAKAAGCERENGRLVAKFRDAEFDLTPPYPKRKYRDLFKEHVGFPATARSKVKAECKRRGIEIESGDYGYWKAVHDLFEAEVEQHLAGPVFVTDYPAGICPLTKPNPRNPVWAERWEFFLGGMELANAFTEMNDPQLQLERFEEQVASKDPESPSEVDRDYVRALAYGLPPAGGCGIGVDRLMMVLLGVDNIRDVLLFPHLRPEQESAEVEAAAANE